MDPQLALIMSNMAQCTRQTLAYDPFVGTGSLLVAAAHFGAHVAGADLDYNLIHSRGLSSRAGQKYRRKDQTIRNNLKQYGLESAFVDILVADFSRQYVRDDLEFDCIVTDPPYGIREKTKKVGPTNRGGSPTQLETSQEDVNDVTSSVMTTTTTNDGGKFVHTKKIKYNLGDIYYDLLEFAVKHLVDSGRLVFWLPVFLEEAERKSMR